MITFEVPNKDSIIMLFTNIGFYFSQINEDRISGHQKFEVS